MTARSLTEAGGDSLESDPASRAPWPLPTHSIGETPTTGIMPPRITGPVTMPGPEPVDPVPAALAHLVAKVDELLAHLKNTGRLRECFNLPALDAARKVLAGEPAPGPEPLTEVITWVPVEQAKPDAMLTVLMWTGDPEYPYENGYWDGERWRADSHGGEPATPTHWTEVKGPQ